MRAEDVYLPGEATFVIANSLATSQKAVTADRPDTHPPPFPATWVAVCSVDAGRR